jgi:hypothetical protein
MDVAGAHRFGLLNQTLNDSRDEVVPVEIGRSRFFDVVLQLKGMDRVGLDSSRRAAAIPCGCLRVLLIAALKTADSDFSTEFRRTQRGFS